MNSRKILSWDSRQDFFHKRESGGPDRLMGKRGYVIIKETALETEESFLRKQGLPVLEKKDPNHGWKGDAVS